MRTNFTVDWSYIERMAIMLLMLFRSYVYLTSLYFAVAVVHRASIVNEKGLVIGHLRVAVQLVSGSLLQSEWSHWFKSRAGNSLKETIKSVIVNELDTGTAWNISSQEVQIDWRSEEEDKVYIAATNQQYNIRN